MSEPTMAFRLRQSVHRLLTLFRIPQVDRELDDEIASHLELATEENLRRGMPAGEARRQALLKFGGETQIKEWQRDLRGVPGIAAAFQDLRFAARVLAKNPGFTAIAVLTLALGIGANTAIFSLVNGILLKSLPYPDPQRLVSITGTYPKGGVAAMRDEIRSMDVAAYYEGHEFNLIGQGEPVRLSGTLVSAELFSVLGTQPELGRIFYPGEDTAGRDGYVILSHALWQQRFAGDRTIIGRSIELEGVNRQVVGVMPAAFRFPSAKTQVWIPLRNDPRNNVLYWADDFMPVLGRLRPGATLAQARTEIQLFQSRVSRMFPWPMPTSWNADVSVVSLQTGLLGDIRLRLLLLLGAVALVVLIACANVANLGLARAATREKEIAVRQAVGANKRRIARQLLTESILLAALGALLGLLIAGQGLALLKAALPADTPRMAEVSMDWRVLVFAGALSVLTGLVSGLLPAFECSEKAPAKALASGTRAGSIPVSRRFRNGLVIGEVASAVLLVTAAALLIRSFWALSHVHPGFQSEHLLTARITPDQSFCADPERCLAFYRTVLNQVQALPGSAGAALVNTLPLNGRVAKRSFEVEDFTPPPGQTSPLFWMHTISSGYFRVMQVTVLAGRSFDDGDLAGAPVAIVAAETARRFWPGQNALGKHIRLLNEKGWRSVVGVVADVRAYDLERNTPNWIDGSAYIPYNFSATLEDGRLPEAMSVVVRSAADPGQLSSALRSSIAGVAPAVPVSELKSMREIVSDSVASPRATALLFSVFAGLAFTLGVIGIYGVLSYLVSNRTREFGVRMALGAQQRQVLWSIMKEGGKFSLLGIVIGIVGAMALMRILSSQLYGVKPTDPATFASVAAVVAAVALFACYIPARRATLVDSIIALRYE
jgi:predicted permease